MDISKKYELILDTPMTNYRTMIIGHIVLKGNIMSFIHHVNIRGKPEDFKKYIENEIFKASFISKLEK